MGTMMVRGVRVGTLALVLAVIAALGVGCGDHRKPKATPHASRTPIALPADPGAGPQHPVRDLVTKERLAVEDRRGLLVLRAGTTPIDTMTASTYALQRRGVEVPGNDFVRLDMWLPGGPQESQLICAAGGQLYLAAALPTALRIPADLPDTTYRLTYTIDRSAPAVRGDESWRYSASEHPEIAGAWIHPFDLRFDDSLHVFYNATVPLDSVPVANADRFVSGRFPGIVLKAGTRVYVDRRWYSLTMPQDLDPEEFARGTSGVVTEGKGEFRDTLRPVY